MNNFAQPAPSKQRPSCDMGTATAIPVVCVFREEQKTRVSLSRYPRRNASRRSGFTLMEVLAALLLIGIVLPVAMDGIGRSVEAGSSAKRRAEAATLAEGKLNEVIILGSTNLVDESGEFGPEWPGYKYSISTETKDYNDSLGLLEVTITVTWPERGDQRQLKVSSLMVDSAATTPVAASTSRAGGAQ